MASIVPILKPTNAADKFKQEHSAPLSDHFLTRAGLSFGALSLAALFGEGLFLPALLQANEFSFVN
jgi:hypothetical protein